jgi:hypothetical protein
MVFLQWRAYFHDLPSKVSDARMDEDFIPKRCFLLYFLVLCVLCLDRTFNIIYLLLVALLIQS